MAPNAQMPTRKSRSAGSSSAIARTVPIAITTTVNYLFGSCVVVPGTGILLNDQMDDFDAAPGAPNAYGLVGTGACASTEMLGNVLSIQENLALLKRLIN